MSADEMRLVPPMTELLTGDESITGTSGSVRDFWAWALSDLRANTVKPVLAEFLVDSAGAMRRVSAHRVGRLRRVDAGRHPRGGEVKRLRPGVGPNAAVVHSVRWPERTDWEATAGYADSATYNADVYVFAFVTAADHASYDPLNLAQWAFWVLPRRTVEATGQKSLALSRVEVLAGGPVSHDSLARAVRAAATPSQSATKGDDP